MSKSDQTSKPLVAIWQRFMITGLTFTLISGCGPSPDNATKVANNPNQLPIIYTSTNVWGAVAKAVAGDKAKVVTAVDNPSVDPHTYQATANDKLTVSQAQLILVNGGGYDDWAQSLATSVPHQTVIINATDLSGFANRNNDKKANATAAQPTSEFNEHVFFSMDTAKKVATAVANQLSQAQPTYANTYRQNAVNFNQSIDQLENKASQLGAGKTVFATEPVTHYLLNDMGVRDVAPLAYVAQSETDAGVSVKVLNDSKALLQHKNVDALVVNAQTEDKTAKELINVAKSVNIPVIVVYETMPTGVTSYQDFITQTLAAFNQAFNKSNNPQSVVTKQ